MHTMAFNGNGFFLAGDGATRRGEGCSEIERPLARIELERTHEQKKPYIKPISENNLKQKFGCVIVV